MEENRDQNIREQVRQIMVIVLALEAVMVVVFVLLGRSFTGALLGAALAAAGIYLSYSNLAKTVERAVEMGADGKGYIQRSYPGRLLVQIVPVIIAGVVPFIDVLAAIIPLFFPRLALYAIQIKESRKAAAERAAKIEAEEEAKEGEEQQ